MQRARGSAVRGISTTPLLLGADEDVLLVNVLALAADVASLLLPVGPVGEQMSRKSLEVILTSTVCSGHGIQVLHELYGYTMIRKRRNAGRVPACYGALTASGQKVVSGSVDMPILLRFARVTRRGTGVCASELIWHH